MAYGGLRGAVGFSLVYILDPGNKMKNIFLTSTLLIVFFTVFFQGGTIKFFVNCLKIKRKEDKDKTHIICDVNGKTMDHLMTGVESVTGNLNFSVQSYFRLVELFDGRYVKKILLSKKAQDRITLRLQKITLDEHFARLYGPAVLISRDETIMAMDDEKEAITPDLRRSGGSKPACDGTTESYRASLHVAFQSNPYERYRNRLSRDDFNNSISAQLERRSKRAWEIEKRLLHQDRIWESDEGEDRDGLVELRGESVPMKRMPSTSGMRDRSRSSIVAADRIKRDYIRAKRSFKSIQIHEDK